jgi:streptogramin lyase
MLRRPRKVPGQLGKAATVPAAVLLIVGTAGCSSSSRGAAPPSHPPSRQVSSPSSAAAPSIIPASVVTSTSPPFPAHVAATVLTDAPEGIIAAFGSIWVANHHEDAITRLDPQTLKTLAKPSADSGAGWGTASGTTLWVNNYKAGTVTRVDPSTNRSSNLGALNQVCGLPAATPGAIWVQDCGDTGYAASLKRLNATTGAVTAKLPVGNGLATAVAVGNTLWATAYPPSTVLQLDPTTGRVLRRIRLPGCPLLTAGSYDAPYLWIGQKPGDDTVPCDAVSKVIRLDTRSGAVRSFPATAPPWVTTGGGSIWTAGFTGGNLEIGRIDPVTGHTTRWTTLPGVSESDGFVAAFGKLWVGDFDGAQIWVINSR